LIDRSTDNDIAAFQPLWPAVGWAACWRNCNVHIVQ